MFSVLHIEFFPREDSNSRQRHHPDLHFTSRGMGKGLKFTVDGPRRKIVVDKTAVTGRVLLGVNVPLVMNERSQIGRVIIRAGGDRVPNARTKIGAESQLSWTPSCLDTFSVVDRKVDFCQGEEPFSSEGEKRVTNANGLAIIWDAGVDTELREGTGGSRRLRWGEVKPRGGLIRALRQLGSPERA